MLKIRRPLGRLIFNMGIAIPGKTVFLIETAPSIFTIWNLFTISSSHWIINRSLINMSIFIKNIIYKSIKNKYRVYGKRTYKYPRQVKSYLKGRNENATNLNTLVEMYIDRYFRWQYISTGTIDMYFYVTKKTYSPFYRNYQLIYGRFSKNRPNYREQVVNPRPRHHKDN